MLGNFSCFCCHLVTFFKINFFKILSDCQREWIQIRLILVQIVCKGYQQTTKGTAYTAREELRLSWNNFLYITLKSTCGHPQFIDNRRKIILVLQQSHHSPFLAFQEKQRIDLTHFPLSVSVNISEYVSSVDRLPWTFKNAAGPDQTAPQEQSGQVLQCFHLLQENYDACFYDTCQRCCYLSSSYLSVISWSCNLINDHNDAVSDLTHCLLVSSADNICEQFGPRSGSKLFDTLMVFLKEFFETFDFEKNQQTTTKRENFPRRQRVKFIQKISKHARIINQ